MNLEPNPQPQAQERGTSRTHTPEKEPPQETEGDPVAGTHGDADSAEKQQKSKPEGPSATQPRPRFTWQDNLALLFDGIVAVATGVGVVFLILQWDQTEEALSQAKEANRLTRLEQERQSLSDIGKDQQNERLLKATENTAVAARDSAAAAKDSVMSSIAASNELKAQTLLAREQVNQARDALRLERRAWVGVIGLKNVSFAIGEPLKFEVVISNSGQSPAEIVRSRLQTRVISASAPFEARYDDATIGSRTVIHPGMQNVGIIFASPKPLTEDLLSQLRSPAIRTYLYGEIIYRDVFGITHYTRYCQWITPNLAFQWCSFYNEAN